MKQKIEKGEIEKGSKKFASKQKDAKWFAFQRFRWLLMSETFGHANQVVSIEGNQSGRVWLT